MLEKLCKLVMDVLKEIFDVFLNPFKNTGIETFEFLFSTKTNTGLAGAFMNPVIKALLYIANTFSWAVFAFALLFYFLKIAQEEHRNWGVIMRCPVNTIIFILFNQIIAQLCFVLPSYVIDAIQITTQLGNISPDDFFDIPAGALAGALSIIILPIAVIGFFIITFMRIGAMTIQIITAPFYVPYALMGESQKVMEWVLGTVAIGLTYVVQYFMFYCGVLIWTYAGSDLLSGVFAMSLMVSTFAVSKGMQKFGWSSGAGHGFQSIVSSSNMLISGVRNLPMK